VLAAATSARGAVADVEGLERGTLSLGIMQSLVAVRLPALLARFHSDHPGIDIRLRQAGAIVLLQDVREGRMELAFASFPAEPPAGLIGHELLNETMTLVCAPDHPLAEKTSVSLADLREQDFVDGHRDWGIRIASDRAFAAAGIERHVAFEINDLQTILDLVDSGLGVAILPRSLAPLRTRLRFIRLRGKPPRWNVTLVAPAHLELSAAARAFLEMVVGKNA
jgi:DNA-binding transcriptional LysR family regulator